MMVMAEKGTHFQGFFSKYRPIFQNFLLFTMQTPKKFWNFFGNTNPCLGIFFVENGTIGISCEKGTHVQRFLVKKGPFRAARMSSYLSTLLVSDRILRV